MSNPNPEYDPENGERKLWTVPGKAAPKSKKVSAKVRKLAMSLKGVYPGWSIEADRNLRGKLNKLKKKI